MTKHLRMIAPAPGVIYAVRWFDTDGTRRTRLLRHRDAAERAMTEATEAGMARATIYVSQVDAWTPVTAEDEPR